MISTFSKYRWTWRLGFLFVALFLLLSLTWGTWAAPHQSELRQSVPTRTPTKLPTETLLPTTPTPDLASPTPEAVTPTSAPPTMEPQVQPTSEPTALLLTPTPLVAAMPASGANHTSVIALGGGLFVLVISTGLILRRKPRQ